MLWFILRICLNAIWLLARSIGCDSKTKAIIRDGVFKLGDDESVDSVEPVIIKTTERKTAIRDLICLQVTVAPSIKKASKQVNMGAIAQTVV